MLREIDDWPEWPRPRRGKIPPSFAAYEQRLRKMLDPGPKRKLLRIPLSPLQLAKEGCRTTEFEALVAQLFPTELPEYEPQPPHVLAALLLRSGYYHAVAERRSTRPYKQRVVDRIQYGERQRSYLWLLGGCRFARSFQVFGMSVEPFTDEQLAALCPEPHKESFADMDEQQCWFLVKREGVTGGWIGKEDWEQIESKKQEEEVPTREAIFKRADEIFEEFERKHNLLEADYPTRGIPVSSGPDEMQEIAAGRWVVRNRGSQLKWSDWAEFIQPNKRCWYYRSTMTIFLTCQG